ncbi:MAG: ATP-binding protein [Pseudomonadota bacterium]
MLMSLRLNNFSVFSNALFEFSPGLNVIIGENGTGKSHLLKLAYVLAYIRHEAGLAYRAEPLGKPPQGGGKATIQRRIAEKLVGVFKPDALGRLCRRFQGRSKAEVLSIFSHNPSELLPSDSLGFSFATNSTREVTLIKRTDNPPCDAPIFFPANEVLSIYPGFASLYEQRELTIDETYYDLCKLLSGPLLRGQRTHEISNVVEPLESIMGGKVRLEAGRFYLYLPGQGRMEIALVAEGIRKVAMLAYLASNGSLGEKGMLFWDEPETNLNPRIMAKIAATLGQLAMKGIQVFVATHSLFLMKEMSLLVERSHKEIPARFFSLVLTEEEVSMEMGEILEDLKTIAALDETLSQDDREQEFLLMENT